MEIAQDYVHIFLGFPPKYSISEVVQRLKGKPAREIFQKFPKVNTEMWGGQYWEDGYFVRPADDNSTKNIIKKYIE